ncbi:MAG: hypothetical protein IJF42_01125 [Clostridia bacterium]|nr:hypothetical protein [Clostridia bacterium]
MSEELDKLLFEVQAEKEAKARRQEELRAELEANMPTKEELEAQRKEKVAGFRLQLDLPDDEPPAPTQTEAPVVADMPEQEAPVDDAVAEEPVAEKVDDAFSGFFTEEDTKPRREKAEKPHKKRKKAKTARRLLF